MVFGFFKKKKAPQADPTTQPTTAPTTSTTSPPKQQAQPKKKSREQPAAPVDIGEDQWIYDTVVQFLGSPTWQIPILTFLDENCIIFDDEEENKFEYTQVHEDFKKLVEGLMDDMICEVQISEEKLMEIMRYGLHSPQDRKLFEQLLIIDNFQVFRNLMIKRNKQLELETLQQLYEIEKQRYAPQAEPQQQGLNQEELEKMQLESEQAEIEHALALSLAVQQEMAQMGDQEDYELQEAMRQSQAEYDKHSQKQKEREEQERNELARIQQQQQREEQARREKEKEAELAKIQAQAQAQAQAQTEAKPQEPSPQKAAEPVEEQKLEPVQQAKVPTKKLEPLSNAPKLQTLPPVEQKSSLPPLATGGRFQPMTIDQLLQEKDDIDNKIQQIKQEEPAQAESLEERKKRLKAQRDLILAKKKAEREAELKTYEAQKGSAPKTEDKAGEPALSTEEAEKRKEIHQKLKNM